MATVALTPHDLPAPAFRLLDVGDAAFTLEFGNEIDLGLVARVNACDAAIARRRDAGGLQGLIETMPTFRSLTLFYDPLHTTRDALLAELQPLLDAGGAAGETTARRWRLPVCYEGDAAPDLADIARATGLGTDDVVALHSGTDYVVYMLGFLPGFPFMGDLPPPLRLPRRTQPRVRVPAGSVAIATGLTAIYPWESPGGWHLIGRCPVPLFDARRGAPSLLAPGDRVRFAPVSDAEYRRVSADVGSGPFDTRPWRDDETREAR